MARKPWRVIPFLLIGLLSGCGGNAGLVPVTGKVTHNGNPVMGVGVTFEPVDGSRSSTGQTNSSGIYRLYYTVDALGALPGEHTVRLAVPPGVGQMDGSSDAEANIEGGHRWPEPMLVDRSTSTIDFELTKLAQK